VQLALPVSLASPPVENTGQMYCNLANTGYMWDTGDKRMERHINKFLCTTEAEPGQSYHLSRVLGSPCKHEIGLSSVKTLDLFIYILTGKCQSGVLIQVPVIHSLGHF